MRRTTGRACLRAFASRYHHPDAVVVRVWETQRRCHTFASSGHTREDFTLEARSMMMMMMIMMILMMMMMMMMILMMMRILMMLMI